MSTPLGSLLGEYAIPLRVWLAPRARSLAADTLIDTLGHLAEVHTDPIRGSASLKGPAVLVVAADDLAGSNRDILLSLAEKAQPGRVVLIGGTSDRDVLMDAINTWRAVRVVPATAPGAEIVDAVRAAGEALRKAVALLTAIDDLDIENTMLDSAINQMESGKDRSISAAQNRAMTTLSQGLADTIRRDQEVLRSLAEEDDSLAQALRGVQTVTDLLGQISVRSAERSAGGSCAPESVDAMVSAAVELASGGDGATVHLDAASGALSTANPYALIHLLTHVIRSSRSSGEVTVRCSASDASVHIDVIGQCPTISTAQGPVARSIAVLSEEGAQVGTGGADGLQITLPKSEAV